MTGANSITRQQKVAIVVDSAASLPSYIRGGPDLQVVPMRLNIGGRTYRDGQDLKPSQFYRILRRIDDVPTTSTPSPTDFIEAFKAAAQIASSVLCITVSPRFSSTHHSARIAAEEVSKDEPDTRIELLDSESAAGGEGLIALEALKLARNNLPLDDVMATARAVVRQVSLVAYLDTLYYVWKGGRIPQIAYWGTSLLKIKPVFELNHGKVESIAKPRTASRASETMLKFMRHRCVKASYLHATVMHADAEEEANRLREKIATEFTCKELFISEFSPVMGTHTGPGMLGIAFWNEEDDIYH